MLDERSLNIAEEEKRSKDKFQILTFRQKVIGDCCDGLTGSPDIYIVTQGGIQSRKNTRLIPQLHKCF